MFDFKSLRGIIQSAAQKHSKLSVEIAETTAELTRIRHAPVNKADINALVATWVGAQADKLDALLKQGLTRNFRNGTRAMDKSQIADVFSEPQKNGDYAISGDFAMTLLCASFGPQITQALATAINAVEWPEEGANLSKRAEEAQRLESKLSKLQAERAELEQEATASGINLQQ